MGAGEIAALAGDWGPMGLLVAYMIWKDVRTEKQAADRIEADKALATSLALLEATVKGLR
jgi:hypothetical protein